jgi:hypothetical protein
VSYVEDDQGGYRDEERANWLEEWPDDLPDRRTDERIWHLREDEWERW